MISIVMPYWNRQEATNKSLRTLAELYKGLQLEVVVVDDGNRVPFTAPDVELDIHVVRLPVKNEPKNPSTCFNAGVAAAKYDFLVLTNPEILHTTPILQAMLDELLKQGNRSYVLAAAWCPEQNVWHCKSDLRVPGELNPPGTGLHFCSMLARELYVDAGGFDEAYRDGAGYEDNDFVNRLLEVKAKFVIRDDLVVVHPKTGATIAWGREKFQRNKAIFDYKWTYTPTNFVCLKAGTAFSAEYVNNLHDMVKRNLPLGFPGKFFCITDDPIGLTPEIEVLPLPDYLEKWWGKLYMFKRGLFKDGARMVFMDLDTLIVGSLKNLVSYKGQFACLRDFYQPRRLGPAVMMWEAGEYCADIWETWVAEGMPRNDWGDLWWLNNLHQGRFAKEADKIQDLYPGAFVSYKAHCKQGLPAKAKVVCFHGLPRPHQAQDVWVKQVWCIGGELPALLEVVSNTAEEQVALNVKSACARKLGWLARWPANDVPVVIVGSGPSVNHKALEIAAYAETGAYVLATNGAYEHLLKLGVKAHGHVIIDAKPENERFITTERALAYFIASQCSPLVFDKVGDAATVVHLNTAGILDSIPNRPEPLNLISSGSTVGLAAIAIAYCLGHRKFYIYGMESSFEDSMHAFPQSGNETNEIVTAEVAGRSFKTTPWLIAQAQDFQQLAAELAAADCELHVRCGGLLGHLAWAMMNTQPEKV